MIPKLYCRTRSPGECAPAISSRHDSPAATTVRTLPLLPAPDPCCPAVVHTHAPSSGSMLSYCGPHPCSQLWIHAARLWSTPMLPAPDPCCPAVVHTHAPSSGSMLPGCGPHPQNGNWDSRASAITPLGSRKNRSPASASTLLSDTSASPQRSWNCVWNPSCKEIGKDSAASGRGLAIQAIVYSKGG